MASSERDHQIEAHPPDNPDQPPFEQTSFNYSSSSFSLQYDLHDPDGMHTHYYDLPQRPALSLPEIPMLRGREDNNFDTWLYYVQAALDTWDLAPFINHQLPRPNNPKSGFYQTWRKTALNVSGWLRLHISEEVLVALSLTCEPNKDPGELVFKLVKSLSATGVDCLPGNQVPGLPKRDKFGSRCEYIQTMCIFFSKDTSMTVTNFRTIVMIMDGLEQDIPHIVAGQRQSLREFPVITRSRFMSIIDRLVDAEF